MLESPFGVRAPEADYQPFAAGPDLEAGIARAAGVLTELIGETPAHRDDLLRLCGAAAFIGLAALSELEIAGRVRQDGGFYTRSAIQA